MLHEDSVHDIYCPSSKGVLRQGSQTYLGPQVRFGLQGSLQGWAKYGTQGNGSSHHSHCGSEGSAVTTVAGIIAAVGQEAPTRWPLTVAQASKQWQSRWLQGKWDCVRAAFAHLTAGKGHVHQGQSAPDSAARHAHCWSFPPKSIRLDGVTPWAKCGPWGLCWTPLT